jgi:nucleotide-binding universal stress UspA family protein
MADSSRVFTLLVAVDYSDPSIVAVDEALRQAAHHARARVVALLVLPGAPPAESELEPAAHGYVERARANLVDLLEARQAHAGKKLSLAEREPPQFEGRVVFGDPAPSIVREASSMGAGLIVVGTHGRHGFERLLLGSVALEVAQRAPCSVVIARAEPRGARSTASEHQEAQSGEPEYPSAALAPGQVVSEPHIDAQRVVLHVLDEVSGRVFVATFQGFGRVTIEPIEGEFSTPPSAEERARAAETALAYSREEQGLFEELFEERARRIQR